MRSYEKCPKCHRFDWLSHVCPPRFLVWCPDDGESIEDAREISAADEEEAAERWADEDDAHGDYRILAGDTPVVCVRDANSGKAPIRRYQVSGETVPQYMAVEVMP